MSPPFDKLVSPGDIAALPAQYHPLQHIPSTPLSTKSWVSSTTQSPCINHWKTNMLNQALDTSLVTGPPQTFELNQPHSLQSEQERVGLLPSMSSLYPELYPNAHFQNFYPNIGTETTPRPTFGQEFLTESFNPCSEAPANFYYNYC